MVSENVIRAVKCAVETRPGMSMDDLILCCTPYSWNQVFLALDELVRNGAVALKQAEGVYLITIIPTTPETEPVNMGAWRTPHLHSRRENIKFP